MATIRDKTVIDVIPVIEGGDLKKTHDHGLIKFNQKILGIFHQLHMPQGTLDDYPEIGCMDILYDLYFATTVFETLDDLKSNFNRFQDDQINVEILRTGDMNEIAHILITVENIPGFRFMADVIQTNQKVKIVNPEVVGVTNE